MIRLGVNVDHVATLRQARRGREPDPVAAAHECELGGADQLTIHLREDRRHIQDRDLRVLRQTAQTPLNLELGLGEDVLGVALDVRPDQVTLVPERREEVTTEGGLDVSGQRDRVARAVDKLRGAGVSVSLFLDPVAEQIEAADGLGVDAIELHTGRYAHATGKPAEQGQELLTLATAGAQVRQLGLTLHAGHGLTYFNVRPVAALEGMVELNIGHSIVARALMVGFQQAVREMKLLVT